MTKQDFLYVEAQLRRDARRLAYWGLYDKEAFELALITDARVELAHNYARRANG